ncbi:unnamed protein product, partial [Ectocarpus sp. 4 AP-2014]
VQSRQTAGLANELEYAAAEEVCKQVQTSSWPHRRLAYCHTQKSSCPVSVSVCHNVTETYRFENGFVRRTLRPCHGCCLLNADLTCYKLRAFEEVWPLGVAPPTAA